MNNAVIVHPDHLSGQPAADRRQSPRVVTVYQVVKVKHDQREALARCRNVSESGMKLEVGMPLSLNDTVIVEVTPDIALDARVVWTNGQECGVTFHHSIDCAALLDRAAAVKRSEGARSPRVNCQIPAQIVAAGAVRPTTIKNISQRGMMVTHSGDFRSGLRVKVLMDNGRDREAVVRWTHDNFAGLMLLDPYGVMDLGGMPRSD